MKRSRTLKMSQSEISGQEFRGTFGGLTSEKNPAGQDMSNTFTDMSMGVGISGLGRSMVQDFDDRNMTFVRAQKHDKLIEQESKNIISEIARIQKQSSYQSGIKKQKTYFNPIL